MYTHSDIYLSIYLSIYLCIFVCVCVCVCVSARLDPTYGQAKAGRPARTYIQQLCEDTECNPEDLPGAMNNREKWREMVRDIRAGGTT